MNDLDFILNELRSMGNEKFKEGLDRFGIESGNSFGIRMPDLRAFAKTIGKDHALGQELWKTGQHEAMLLAVFISDKKQVTIEQMESWVKDFNSWDVCDQTIGNLFDKTEWAYDKAIEWCQREPEFEKRAGFAMMAMLAVHDKKEPDSKFTQFFPYLEQGSSDNRNFVKKAVNWAIRQIGKRNLKMNQKPIDLSQKIQKQGTNSAKWIAADALRELLSEKIQTRLS